MKALFIPPLNIEPQRTLLPSMYASLRFFVSSRTSFHLFLSDSLDTYRVSRLRVAAWKTINGYMGCVDPRTRFEILVSAVVPPLRCSGGPMNGPRRRKSKGIGWRAKLLKGRSVEEMRGRHTWDSTTFFSVSASLTGSVFVRCSVRMTERSIS